MDKEEYGQGGSFTVNPHGKDEQLSQGYPCILKFCLASLRCASSENVNMASQGACILTVG